jgi:chromosome segregation protein
MTDVIFNGSSSRKRAPSPKLFSILTTRSASCRWTPTKCRSRRIYRSGEAEYLINRVPARLKDIRDLFLGTGAGTSAYSIIEQGRVDQLLQATNIARRTVFEEAAGISRFKARKVDAQRKLERVAQNLLRLTDIVTEVQTQLSALRSQAAKAAKFREYTQELRTLRIGSAADDYRALSARLEAIDGQRHALAVEIEQFTAEARECEMQQAGAESQLAESEDRLRIAERRQAENREAIAGFEATVRHQTARRQELEADYQRLEKQQAELAARGARSRGRAGADCRRSGEIRGRLRTPSGGIGGGRSDDWRADRGAWPASGRRSSTTAALLDSVRQLSAFGSRSNGLEAQRQIPTAACEGARERVESLEEDCRLPV